MSRVGEGSKKDDKGRGRSKKTDKSKKETKDG